jgi:hypothetical protein
VAGEMVVAVKVVKEVLETQATDSQHTWGEKPVVVLAMARHLTRLNPEE